LRVPTLLSLLPVARSNLALLWQILAIDWRNWIPESDFQ
jgi:hypothetical protein